MGASRSAKDADRNKVSDDFSTRTGQLYISDSRQIKVVALSQRPNIEMRCFAGLALKIRQTCRCFPLPFGCQGECTRQSKGNDPRSYRVVSRIYFVILCPFPASGTLPV